MQTIRKGKVIHGVLQCHDFGPAVDGESIYEGIPYHGFGYYASRCFAWAGSDDLVFLPPDSDSLGAATVASILNGIGLGPRPENIIFMGMEDEDLQVADPNGDMKILQKLGSRSQMVVQPFAGKAFLPHIVAKKCGMTVKSSRPTLAKMIDDKAWFQRIPHPLIPKGSVVRSLVEAENFFASSNGQVFFAKTTQNSSGQSACVVSPDGEGRQEVRRFLKQGKIVVMQKYYEHEKSPSVNMEIYPDGTIEMLFVSDQILSVSDVGTLVHEGNIFPAILPKRQLETMRKGSLEIASFVARTGYHGPIGVDWIVNGEHFEMAVEINARVTSPRYPFVAMKKLGARSFSMENVHFHGGMTAEQIRHVLDDIFWEKERGSGVVFFNFNPMRGKLALAGFGKCREEVLEVSSEAKMRLQAL